MARLLRFLGFKSERAKDEQPSRERNTKSMTREEMLAMEGTGWEGDLDEMRQSRVLDR